ncbi:MAG: acyl carrier protein, partial [Desulfovibrio sp.]|nr:acyl carrier protein [Desulfovibrio sp.]
ADRAAQVLALLAEASGRPVTDIRPEHDLRHDLALRSSRFPLLLQEAERRLGVRVEFEALLRVSTVGDLVAVLLGRDEAAGGAKERLPAPARNRRLGPFPPLLRFAPPDGAGPFVPLPLDPAGTGPGVAPGGVYALCVRDRGLLPEIWGGLASFGATLAVPAADVEACAPLLRAGSRVVPLDMDAAGGAGDLVRALDGLLAAEGRVDGVFLVPEAGAPVENNPDTPLAAACGAWCAEHAPCWFAALRRWRCPSGGSAALLAGEKGAGAAAVAGWIQAMTRLGAAPVLALADDGRPLGRDALGDSCAAELFRGRGGGVLLAAPGRAHSPAVPPLLDRPEVFAPVYPEPWSVYRAPLAPESGLFQGGCQFSAFADAALLPLDGADAGRLTFSGVLLALLQGARLLLPWLTVTGFSDVRFFAPPPPVPPGITREGRVTARARPWIMHDGAWTRMCRTSLDIRELTANGRHTDTFAPLAGAMALLASGPRDAPPLGPLAPGTEGPELPLGPLYARLGVGAGRGLLSRLVPVRGAASEEVLAVHRALLVPGASARPIAPGMDWGYACAMRLSDAVMESCRLVLVRDALAVEDAGDGAPSWRCEGVGYLRFGEILTGERGEAGTRTLEIRRTWDDGRRVRFDAQVGGPGSGVLLTVHHLEFERRKRPETEGAPGTADMPQKGAGADGRPPARSEKE